MGKILIDIPDSVHKALKDWKKEGHFSITSYCNLAILKKAIEDGLIKIKVREINGK